MPTLAPRQPQELPMVAFKEQRLIRRPVYCPAFNEGFIAGAISDINYPAVMGRYLGAVGVAWLRRGLKDGLGRENLAGAAFTIL